MDYIREIMNVGDDVLRTVTSAIENNDFSNLSADLKMRLGDFAEDVKEDARARSRGTKARPSTYNRTTYWYDPRTGESGTFRPKASGGRTTASGGTSCSGGNASGFAGAGRFNDPEPGTYPYKRSQMALTPFRPRLFGRGGSIVKMITGIFGMISFLPTSIMGLILAIGGDLPTGLFTLLFLVPLSAGSIWLTLSGNNKRKLIDIYNRYAEIIGPAEYYPMEELAANAGTSEEGAVRNVEKLMKANMLPQGKFDEQKTTLMLTPKVWKQYQAAEKARHQREAEEQRRTAPETASGGNARSSVLQEGNAFVKKVHDYNVMIPDPEMSRKLDRLESIIQKIFRQVEKEPDSAPDLHKLMNYYLPTIEKLLQAYVELDDHPSGIENVDRTRKEIEEAVDTVNVAFENLFEDLFQDTAWDISSDISVMKNMMKQDGLMEDSKHPE